MAEKAAKQQWKSLNLSEGDLYDIKMEVSLVCNSPSKGLVEPGKYSYHFKADRKSWDFEVEQQSELFYWYDLNNETPDQETLDWFASKYFNYFCKGKDWELDSLKKKEKKSRKKN